jgi:hypothetical protein
MIFERTLPTTSLGIVICVTAVLVTLLLTAVGVGTLAWIGVISGIGLSLSLWFVRWERWRSVGLFFSSLLATPVAAGLTVALIGTIAVPTAGIFPIESIQSVGTDIIDIGIRTVVVGSCVVAAIGVTATPADIINTETTGTYANLLLRVQLPPVAISSLLFASGMLSLLQSRGIVGNVISSFLAVFFSPDPGRTHVAVFALMIAVGVVTVGHAIDSLPIAELLPDYREPIQTATTRLSQAGWLGVFFVLPAGLVEFGLGQRTLAVMIPTPVYDSVVAVTATPLLRRLIWWLILWSIGIIVAVRLLRRVVQGSSEAVGITIGPYAAGAVVAGIALVVSDPLFPILIEAIPSPAGGPIAAALEPAMSQFGTGSLMLAFISTLLMASSLLVGALWFGLRVRYIPERTSGVTIAASGLFIASGAALTLDVPALLGMAGLVGAIVVWDAGAFGMALYTEIGAETDSRRTELVHTGGTLSVGVVGSLLTIGLTGVASGSVSPDQGTALVALVFCLVALVALLIALR